jgi:hypothetical protein
MRSPQSKTVSWLAIAGYIAGVLTLVFLMGIVFASILGHEVPTNTRFTVVSVLALGAALSFAFVGGTAAAHGTIPIPFTEQKPIAFSVTGGIAVFIIVLTLGYYLYVPSNRTFTVTVAPLADGMSINVPGKILLQYGGSDLIQDINSLGQAEFKMIPIQYLGQKAKVSPKIPGYQEQFQEIVLTDAVLNIELHKIDTKFSGRITPVPKGKTVRVLVDGESNEVVPDEFGRFEILVHGKFEGKIRVRVLVNGVQKYDDLQLLPGPAVIPIRN